MSSPADQLRSFLLADASVAALVDTRIYHVRAPSDVAMPQVIMNLANTAYEPVLSGGSQTGPMYEFDVTCAAASAEQAWSLTQAIASALEDYDGEFKTGEPVEAHVEDIQGAHVIRGDVSQVPQYAYLMVIQFFDH